MSSVFISYRRDDSALICGRINDRLVARFGKSAVFMDVHSIPPGEDFEQYISSVIQQCAIQLVVIGKRWLTAADQYGRRRIDKPDDMVRIEIETAIRFGVVVIPVLIEGMTMPLAEALPDSLTHLAKLNALPVRGDPDFDNDIERIITALEPKITNTAQQLSNSDLIGKYQCHCCTDKRQTRPSDEGAPSAERERELEILFNTNVANAQPPYFQVNVRSIGELRWILQRREWSGSPMSADRIRPNLVGIDLSGVNLSGIDLNGADLTRASLGQANLTGALMASARLESANLGLAILNGADLGQSDLRGANLAGAELRNANLDGAIITEADLSGANLSGAYATRANLQGTVLARATLNQILLTNANLQGATLFASHLNGADISECQLAGADLRQAHFDSSSRLIHTKLDSNTRLADVMWNGAALATIDWPHFPRVGDEVAANLRESHSTRRLNRVDRILAYEEAVRAYRGLSIALRSQGLMERSTAFRLREQVMERRVLQLQGKIGEWLLSLVYAFMSGYGERPMRLLVVYMTIVALFAEIYFALPAVFPGAPHVTLVDALVLSITSFHGRGLVPGFLSLSDIVAQISVVEAVIGVFIEIMFVAVILRRFLRD